MWQGLCSLRLAEENSRIVVSRRVETGSQLEAALKQRLCIEVAAQPGRDFGEHPQRRNVGLVLLQMRSQERLGLR